MQVRQLTGVCCVVAVSVMLSACSSIVHPQVPIPQPNTVTAGQLSYDDALKTARATESDLQQRVSDLDDFDFWSGAGLITAGIAGTAIGVYGGSQNAAIGVALAGGTILGARAYVPLAVRRSIYTQGTAAIECSIVATEFGSTNVQQSSSVAGNSGTGSGQTASAGGAGLAGIRASLAGSLQQNVSTPGMLAGLQVELIKPAGTLSGVGALASVKAAELATAIRQTNDSVDAAVTAAESAEANKPQRLLDAVYAVVIAVNSQLAENSLNPTQALTAAEQGVTSLTKDARDAAKKALDAVNNQQQVAQDTASVAKQTSDAAQAQSQPALQASAAQLQSAAQNAQDIASQVKPILTQILSTLNVPTTCFGGLISG